MTRTSVFEGGTVDLLHGEEGRLHTRLGCFDGRRFDWFKPDAVTDMGWVGEHVTLQTRAGEWWLGTGEGVYRFAATNDLSRLKTARPIAAYGVRDGLAALQAFRLFEDRQGNVWISTTSPSTAGLARWERATEKLTDLASSPGMAAAEGRVAGAVLRGGHRRQRLAWLQRRARPVQGRSLPGLFGARRPAAGGDQGYSPGRVRAAVARFHPERTDPRRSTPAPTNRHLSGMGPRRACPATTVR